MFSTITTTISWNKLCGNVNGRAQYYVLRGRRRAREGVAAKMSLDFDPNPPRPMPMHLMVGLQDFISALYTYENGKFSKGLIFIYGSFASGRSRAWSDLDMAVVSDGFKEIPWLERRKLLRSFVSLDAGGIHPIGITCPEYGSYIYPPILRAVRAQHIAVSLR